MHIVFVTCELATRNHPTGGLGTFTSNISRVFNRHGHKVDIILATTKEFEDDFDDGIGFYKIFIDMDDWEIYNTVSALMSSDNVENKEIRISLMYLFKSQKVNQIIERIHENEPIDILHFCNHGSLSLYFHGQIPYVIRISGFSNIWFQGGNTINGSLKYADNPEPLSQKLEIAAMRKTPYIIAPSKLIADIANEELGMNVNVIESPYVFDSHAWDYQALSDLHKKTKRYLLFYGTMSVLKGIHIIAQISKPLLSKYPELSIVLSGRDALLNPNEDIRASDYVLNMAGEYSDRIIYLGRLSREQLYPIISDALMVVLPSRIENLSNSCIEAMAMGKIVIATEGASYEQLIEDGISGFLCKRDDPEAFIKAINDVMLLDDNNKRLIVEMAKKRIELLNPDNIYKEYLKYYNDVIRNYWDKEL